MAKSADAFRTISEVAEWLETPAHVLRFWESKFSQVKPVKRAGGRRYYRPSDMQLLGGIKKLLHSDGMTIKGVQKLLRENGVKHVAEQSPPLDDIATEAEDVVATKAEDVVPTQAEDAVTVEAEDVVAAKAEDVATTEAEDVVTAKAEDVVAVEPVVTEVPKEAPAAPPPEEDITETPVMPSFTHRARDTEKVAKDTPAVPAAPAAAETPTPTAAATPAPAAAKPSTVSVPDDPADDIAADPGILDKLSGVQLPISDNLADRLSQVLSRMRQGRDGNGATQDN